MIAPRSAGKRSEMSASSPSAAGVAPASTNRPAPASRTAAMRMTAGSPPEWFARSPPAGVVREAPPRHEDGASDDAIQDDRRPAHRFEAIAPVQQADAEDDRDG